MPIQLTEPQQRVLDAERKTAPQVIDPRTNTAYFLIPAKEYETVREIIEDEQRQRAISQIAQRNAVGRMNEKP
jgi:hypothetical protein